MSNSPLISYTKISPNRTSPRNHKIDTITIHCFVGQVTAERGAEVFQPISRKASCNYVIGYDGRIALVCPEADRSWCSSNSSNDHRAVTIEVASETAHPYKITDKAYNALIKLCADICKRNGIKELKWQGDKALVGQVDKQNMTVHRWFANKACPGDYLYNLHGQIAKEVNAILKNKECEVDADMLYKVQVGAFSVKANAEKMLKKLKDAGFEGYIVAVDDDAPAPAPAKKSNEEIAKEVIAGKWGNGADRKNRLTQAGYNYSEVQKCVNKLLTN